jgi:hypothetical protein
MVSVKAVKPVVTGRRRYVLQRRQRILATGKGLVFLALLLDSLVSCYLGLCSLLVGHGVT